MLASNDPDDPPEGKTSVRLGRAYLEPAEEKGHYALRRRFITVRNDGGTVTRHESESGVLLGIYRRAGAGDQVDMRTEDPQTHEALSLTLVWQPGPGD